MTIITLHGYREDRLQEVKKTAQEIGYVEINAFFDGETYYCLEGTHRMQAAYELQIPVRFRLRDWDEEIDSDMDGIAVDGKAKVSDIYEFAYDGRIVGTVYKTSDFASVETL